MTPDDYEEELLEIWPENIPVYELWGVVGDQWRMGARAPVALDLIPVFHELDRMGLDREAYDAMLDGVKAMASAALAEIHKQLAVSD